MNILLVSCSVSGLPKHHEMVFYPLGLMSLASYLRENGFDNI